MDGWIVGFLLNAKEHAICSRVHFNGVLLVKISGTFPTICRKRLNIVTAIFMNTL